MASAMTTTAKRNAARLKPASAGATLVQAWYGSVSTCWLQIPRQPGHVVNCTSLAVYPGACLVVATVLRSLPGYSTWYIVREPYEGGLVPCLVRRTWRDKTQIICVLMSTLRVCIIAHITRRLRKVMIVLRIANHVAAGPHLYTAHHILDFLTREGRPTA